MKIRLLAAPLLILFFASLTALAQTTEFTYQGKLNNNGGAATGNYDFEFRLFAVPTDGAALATQQKLNVAVRDGIFTVSLDFGAANFDGSNRWVEIAVRPAGGGAFTVLAPRQPLTSAPYAIKSLKSFDAENLGGFSVNQFVQTNDPRLTDERNPLPGSSRYIQNTTTQQAADFNINGSGIIGGNLGIGTPTPRAALDVNGNAVQDLSAGGFVKAMAFVTVTQTPQGQTIAAISRCFNGALNSSTGNCGFTANAVDTGGGSFRVRLNFGFTVDNRFVSFNELDDPGNTALNTNVGRIAFADSTTVQVIIARATGKVFIFVY